MLIKMKKLSLKGAKSDLKKVVEALKSTGVFEMSAFKRISNTSAEFDSAEHDYFTDTLARITSALAIINSSQAEYDKLLRIRRKNDSNSKELITNVPRSKAEFRQVFDYDEFKSIASREQEVVELIGSLEKLSAKLYETKAQINHNNDIITELRPYCCIDTELNLMHDTREAFVLMGLIAVERFEQFKSDFDLDNIIIKTCPVNEKTLCVICIGHKNYYPMVHTIFDYGFVRNKLNFAASPQAKINELEEQNKILASDRFTLLQKSIPTKSNIELLKTYFDYVQNELETEAVLGNTLQTDEYFILNGWVVEQEQDKIIDTIKNVSPTISIKAGDPAERDNPPVLVRNRSLIRPYESITNLYGAPSKNDLDPNMFVAFFYFLFFGLMIGDIGYGILMFVTGLVVLLYLKPKRGAKDLISIICMGGISAVIWGILFGSFFGVKTIDSNLLSKILPAGLIDPVTNGDDALLFLALTMGLGVLHIVFGLGLKFYNLMRQRKILDAFCDAGTRILLFIGIIIAALSFLIEGLSLNIGLYIAIGAAILIFLTSLRKGKGILGRFAGGFGGLWSLVNYLSDILSYARLFGLGLVGMVIGMVANTMGGMVMGIPIVGMPLGLLIALVFHMFNLAIGLLSAYVHNARLQFIEFFGKFYEGGGRNFKPLGRDTKYIVIRTLMDKKIK